jgi:hypothetical protein
MRVIARALNIAEVYPRGTMRAVKRTILSLAIILVVASAFAANFASDEQALRKLDRDMALATYMGEGDWFRIHLSDDYVLITASGVVKTKAELIAEADKGVKMDPFEPTDVTIRAHGGTAIVSGRMLQKYTANGERVTADLRYSDVWIKTDNGWFAVSGQVSPVSIKRERIK